MKTLSRLVAVVAAVVVQSLSLSAEDVYPLKDVGGITNIHVNAFVKFQDPAITRVHAGNASMWLNMTEGGVAQKIYLDQHYNCEEHGLEVVISNSTPDAFFPTNTVMAHVWRGRGTALTNAYNVLSANVAKTIIDAEAVSLLTNFAPVVKSVTRGVGSATIAYVDDDGETHLGKTVILGCEPDKRKTVYDAIVKELKRFSQGREEEPEPGFYVYYVTNSTVAVLGSMEPVVFSGRSGRVCFCSSKGILGQIYQAANEFKRTGKMAYYDHLRDNLVLRDAELRKIDPTYAAYNRNFKTEGFERFAYADLSGRYQPAVAKMFEQLGLDPALAVTNKTFRYLATLCSQECEPDNTRMRIDIQGTRETLRLIGATHRISNLFLVNAGILDKDFVTFDEDWTFDKELLAQISSWAKATREKLGVGGLNYWYDEGTNRIASHMNLTLASDGFLRRLLCADEAGKGEKNLCALYLPTNAVAAFTFQPEAAAWTELNRRLFSLVGQKGEVLDELFDAFASHPNSFGKSAAVGFLPGSGFFSAVKIEDENLWISLRILLEQFGGKTHVSTRYPEVTVIELPYFHISYDRLYNVVKLESGAEAGTAATVASRDWDARLINSPEFEERMGIEWGKGFPDRNALVYLAPACDTAVHEKLELALDTLGLGALKVLVQHGDLSKTWLCGYGAYGDDGIFRTTAYMSTNVWKQGHRLMSAVARTFGQIMAAAYPYKASKARVFTLGNMKIHVSRADNWDDINGRLSDCVGDNIRFRIQGANSKGQPVDRVFSGRLEADGSFKAVDGAEYDCGYLTSEGIFAEYKGAYAGCYIGRETTEIEPELSVLPSAEEIAEQLKKVVDAIGVSNVTVGAAASDGRTGPNGEKTVIRETTIVPVKGGGLDRLLAKKESKIRGATSPYMPSNTVYGTAFWFAEGALTNIIAALKYAQPELMEYFEKIFGGFGFTEAQLGATVNDALALGIAREEDGLEPYFVVQLKNGQNQHWVALTNRLYNTPSVTVTDFKASVTPGLWEAIAFTRIDPLSGRAIKTCYTRIFESGDRVPHFIITQNDKIQSGITYRVRHAGLFGEDCLKDDETFKACYLETDSDTRGFAYLAPIAEKYWFFDRFYVTEDGELVIRRRTSAAAAPYEATVARFAVNFFEALSGEKSVVTFEKDAAADKVATAATSNVVAALRKMRTTLGVTGLDFYDAGLEADGRYGNSELAIGTKGDGCEFLRRFAADAPASEHLVEQYVPATACALATMNGEAGMKVDDVNAVLKASAELLAEKHPKASAAITNFLASTAWKIVTENVRLTGTHKALAVLQDFDHPFVKPNGVSTNSLSAGYAALGVIGPMTSDLPFIYLKEALVGEERKTDKWTVFTTNGVEYLTMTGIGEKIRPYAQPTFAFDASNKTMIVSTRLDAAMVAMTAGREGTNRLIDSDTFFDVTGFKKGEPLPAHNSLYYLAPQNDDILGCTLRRVLKPYLPDGYAMLLDRPSLKGYWGAAYGKRVNDAFRVYTHAGAKGHTAFLALGQALLKTVAEGLRVRQPYDWTDSKVFRSADWIFRIDYTGESGKYARSNYLSDGEFYNAAIYDTDSDNDAEYLGTKPMRIMSKSCIFVSSTKGWSVVDAGRDAFHLLLIDEETDPTDFKAGVALEVSMRELTLPAGEKVEKALRIYPAEAKITKVTGMPKGLSIKKTNEGYSLVGTPTKVGEDCLVTVTAACAGYETMTHTFHFMISNYASDCAELAESFELTAGVTDQIELRDLIGWAASGVPGGMKFDKQLGLLTGTPAKPGTYVVIFSKKIDGKVEKVSTVITVGGEDSISIDVAFSDKTSGLRADGVTRAVYVGVKVDWPIAVTGLEDVETKLTAKGLPSGLKLVKTVDKITKEISYAIKGIATKASVVDKKTGKMKPSTITLKGTNKYKWTGEETFDLVVKALPAWAVGTFNGYHGYVHNINLASSKVVVSHVGKVSVSISGVSAFVGKPTTDAVTLNGFDGYDPENSCFTFAVENVKFKSGKVYRYSGAIGLDPSAIVTLGRYIASYECGAELSIDQANNHDWTWLAFPTGKKQLTLSLTDEVNPGLGGLTLKFTKGGKVTVAGTVVDSETDKSVRVSASAALVYKSDEDVSGDGIFPASVGFVVKTKAPFYAYVPVWLKRSGDTMVEVYETDPTKDK